MRFVSVAHDIGHALVQGHPAAVFQLGNHAALGAVNDVPFFTPVIGLVTGTVYHSPDTYLTDPDHLPYRTTPFTSR